MVAGSLRRVVPGVRDACLRLSSTCREIHMNVLWIHFESTLMYSPRLSFG